VCGILPSGLHGWHGERVFRYALCLVALCFYFRGSVPCVVYFLCGVGVCHPQWFCVNFCLTACAALCHPNSGVLQPKCGMYFVCDSDDLVFCSCVFVQLCARMLARLGGCCWFPQLYTAIGDCTEGVPYARGRVFYVRVSCPALFLQSVVA
jgi:hypothetical protein